MSWQGDNPFFLLISPNSGGGIQIDLDESQWMTTYAEYMRVTGIWFLVDKTSNTPLFSMIVNEGEQPYYTSRTLGVVGSSGSNDIKTYGVGKKLVDGSIQRLWVLPGGIVCGGDDVDRLGILMVKQMGPRPQEPT
jgi:hypothetical protein